MINIAIVEDEAAQSDMLEEYILRFSKENGEVFQIKKFDNAVTFLSNYKQIFDLIFMDIEMPDLSGMDAAFKLRELDNVVTLVFVTNLSQFALKGYEVGALDFIVKPVMYYSFCIKMKRALLEIKMKKDRAEEISLTGDNGVYRIVVASIKFIEVSGHHLIFHTFKGIIDVCGSLSDMEQQLAGKHFSRCDNSYLVNLEYVTEINANSCVVGGETVPISRRRKKNFIDELTLYVGGNG